MEKYCNLAIKDFGLNKQLDIYIAEQTVKTGKKVEKYRIVEDAIKEFIKKDKADEKII